MATEETSLSDLPPEIHEHIAQYLTHKEITVLRSVNRYLRSVFSRDVFWKPYLRYPEKYFLCDLRSKSKAPGIAEIVEEIAQEKIGRWKGYLKLQKAHFQNWATSQDHTYDTISLPAPMMGGRREMVDDNNEHWLFMTDKHFYMHIWNITSEPRELAPVYVGLHYQWDILPQGRVLIKKRAEDGKQFFELYEFESPDYTLTVKCKILPFLKMKVHNYCIINKTLLIYARKYKFKGDKLMELWDVLLGKFIMIVDLSKDIIVNTFVDYYYLKVSELEEDTENEDSSFDFSVVGPSFPNVILVFSLPLWFDFPSINTSQINVFSLKTMKITHMVDMLDQYVNSVKIISNKVYVWVESFRFSNYMHAHLYAYDLYSKKNSQPTFTSGNLQKDHCFRGKLVKHCLLNVGHVIGFSNYEFLFISREGFVNVITLTPDLEFKKEYKVVEFSGGNQFVFANLCLSNNQKVAFPFKKVLPMFDGDLCKLRVYSL